MVSALNRSASAAVTGKLAQYGRVWMKPSMFLRFGTLKRLELLGVSNEPRHDGN